MQVLAVLFAVVAAAQAGLLAPGLVAPATTLIRTPSFDSAVIKSDRLGGNFAYSSVEGHAYAAVSPVVQNVVRPVGVSYTATPVATPIAAPIAAPLAYGAIGYGSPLAYSAYGYGSPLAYGSPLGYGYGNIIAK